MAQYTEVGVSATVKNFGAFMRNLGKMDKATQDVGKTAGGIGKQFTGLGRSVLGVGATMAKTAATGVAALGTAIVGIGAVSLKAASDYESAFAGVIKTTDGLVDEFGELTGLGQELHRGFRDLSLTIPVSPEQLAAIGELGGQLGITTDNLLGFTETIAALDVATNLTAEEAAMELARFSNVMGTTQTDIGRLGSTIVELGNNMATTEKDIMAFGSRIAGAGAIVGLTEAEVLAIGAAMSSVGVQAEAGGTAVQKVLIAMNNAVNASETGFVDNTAAIGDMNSKLGELQADLVRAEQATGMTADEMLRLHDEFIASGGTAEEWGRQLGDRNREKLFQLATEIGDTRGQLALLEEQQGRPVEPKMLTTFARVAGVSAEEFQQAWREDAMGAFQMFVAGLGREGDNAVNILDELGLADQRLITSFLKLSKAEDVLTDAVEHANVGWEENEALTKEAEARYRTFESQMQLLKNSLHDIAITVGGPLLDYFADLIKKVRPLINEFGKKLPEALEIFGQTIRDIFSGGDIGELLSSGIGKVGELFGIPPEVIAQFDAFAQKVVEVGRAVAEGLGAAFQFLRDNVFPVLIQAIQFVIEHWDAFKGALIAIGAILGGAAIAAAIAGIASAIGALLSPIGLIIAAAAALGAAWSTNFMGIRDILTAFWEGTGRPIFEQVVAWLQTNIPIAIQAASQFFTETLIPAIQQVATWLGENLPIAIETARAFIVDTLIPGIQQLAEFFAPTIARLIEGFQGFLQALAPLGPKLAEFMPVVAQLAALLGGALLIALKLIGEVVAFLLPHVGEMFTAMATMAIDAVTGLVDFLTGAIQMIVGLFTGDLAMAREGAAQVLGGIAQIFTATFEGILGQINVVIGTVEDLISKLGTIQLPWVLQPESPTPFEMGLRGIATALTGVVAAALQTFAAASLAVFEQVRLKIVEMDMALQNVYTITLPQLMAITQQTTNLMIASFRSVIPTVQELNALFVEMANLLAEAGEAAKEAAKHMSDGFEDAKDSIKDELIPALKDLIKWLESVRDTAREAASATRDVGEAGGGEGGAGYQRGANFRVPGGFGPSTRGFPMRVHTGEQVIVVPRGEVGAAGTMRQNVFNLNVSTRATAGAVIDEFEVMAALVG